MHYTVEWWSYISSLQILKWFEAAHICRVAEGSDNSSTGAYVIIYHAILPFRLLIYTHIRVHWRMKRHTLVWAHYRVEHANFWPVNHITLALDYHLRLCLYVRALCVVCILVSGLPWGHATIALVSGNRNLLPKQAS